MKKVLCIGLNILIVFIVMCTLIVIPFLIEKIVVNSNNFPFNYKIILSQESWFGFISSYIGAIGTVILGVIALWQNKRYKNLSDIASKEVKEIQMSLIKLSEKMVEAVRTLERIELTVYSPVIEKLPYNYYGIPKESLDEDFRNEKTVYQRNLINITQEDCSLTLDKLMSKYKTYGFTIRNIGEKSIRNFNCVSVKINEKSPNSLFKFECDIASSECAHILFVNLPLDIGFTEIDLKFEFNNLLMEEYHFDVKMIITYGEDFDVHFINFGLPSLN